MTDVLPASQAERFYRSQNGEDRWLEAYFSGKAEGFFVEVGAYDGVSLSNTYYFEHCGWIGILVEPDPVMAERCRKSRPRSMTYQCAVGAPGGDGEAIFFQVAGGEAYSTTTLSPAHRQRLDRLGLQWREVRVPVRTLDSILEEVSPPCIDFVSIDVEGGELAVLRGFTLRRWRPAVVIVETNAKKRDSEIRRYFLAQGYAYRHSIDVNDFYLPVESSVAGVWLLDTFQYLGNRLVRRLARFRQLARRAWRKRMSGVG